MPPRRQYTDEEKANALLALEASGGAVSATARRLGIPIATLRMWKNGEGVGERVQRAMRERRPALTDRLEDILHLILDKIPARLDGAPLPHLVSAASVVAEKMENLARAQMTQSGGPAGQDRVAAVAQVLQIALARQQAALSAAQQPADGVLERVPQDGAEGVLPVGRSEEGAGQAAQ